MPKAILVGLGGRGITWLEALREHPKYETVAYVEPVEQRLNEVGEKYGISRDRLYTDLNSALRESGADVVIDVTPPQVHEAVVTKAFAAGLDVLGEKPLADSMAAAQRIVQQAEQTGCLYMVGQNYRFATLVRTTRRLIEEGTIGTPEYLDVGFYKGARFGGFRAEMAYPLLTDMSIHHFDMMRYLLGQNAKRLYARGMNPSWSWFKGAPVLDLIIEWENGAVCSYHGSWCSLGKQTTWNGDWRIEGAGGSLNWENDKLEHYYGDWHEVQVAEIDPDHMPETGQAAMLTEFESARREGRPPECAGADNIHSIAIVFAALESIKRGEPVDVNDVFTP